MAQWRRCVLECDLKTNLYGLPKAEEVKRQWLKFIFNYIPQQYNPSLYLCYRHFTEDCFVNWAQFNARFAQRLVLRDGAVPTLFGPEAPGSQPGTSQQSSGTQQPCTAIQYHHVGCQTDCPQPVSESAQHVARPKMVSVGTQLSRGTLKDRPIRSKGIQATVSCVSVGTETSRYPKLPLSSTPMKGVGWRPRKRPRLEEEEEVKAEEADASAELSESLDSTYDPGKTIKEESDESLQSTSTYAGAASENSLATVQCARESVTSTEQ
ncbi:hypothetical protein GJAV_G00084110 [Gymnothorax javanicus]|nr:hypothetical protein GJAV_G00084110 [Gymnothorax javanicus]